MGVWGARQTVSDAATKEEEEEEGGVFTCSFPPAHFNKHPAPTYQSNGLQAGRQLIQR
jgi:hypothetical protein